MDRRRFLEGAALAGAGSTMKTEAKRDAPRSPALPLARPGPKPVVRGKRAVASSSHPIVTDTMLTVMKDGGNAVDAGIAGCLAQAVVQPEMTNHTGTVTFVCWEAKTGKAYQLLSSGTLVSGLAPFRPLPPGLGVLDPGPTAPCACIPGFMPGLAALHEKFGTRPWPTLCAPAVRWATEGYPVHSFQYGVMAEELASNVYFPSGRDFFLPGGFVPAVGELFKNADMARTMSRLAAEGPSYFTTGEWAQHFVAEGNRLGWPVTLEHMTAVPPRWGDPLRYTHRGHDILQLAPPERTGVFSALVLGILDALDVQSLGHYTKSAESLYYIAHALRWAEFEVGFLNDPELFEVPVEAWLAKDHHRMVADVLRRSRPRIDLTEHIRVSGGKPALAAAGLPTAGPGKAVPVTGSCELSIVDPSGNWVQMMNTLQAGGIPGVVVDGVPMVGTHAVADMSASIAGWFTGGGRLKLPIGNTLVLKDGKPWLSLGTPGNVHVTVPQVLSNVLDFGMDPYEACAAPRMLSLRNDYVLEIESRLPAEVVGGLARLGIQVKPLPPHDYHMGSFQMSWRDPATGLLNSSSDPRRAGQAGGF